jgi:peptidoglycan lytic transglycosylase F
MRTGIGLVRMKAMILPIWAKKLALVLPLLLIPAAFERGDRLDRILGRGELTVISRNSPTTYYLDKSGPAGFEYALAERLAKQLGVKLAIAPAFSLQELFNLLHRSEVDIAAAGLTLTGDREALFPHTRSYHSQIPQMVYVAGTRRPRSLDDIGDLKLAVLEGSSHADSLRAMRRSLPDLQWQEVEEADSMALLELLDSGQAQLAIIDSHEFKVQQSLYPRLKVAFDLAGEQEMVWYLPPDSDNQRLISQINHLFEAMRASGDLDQLWDAHFGHVSGFSRISSHTFNQKMRNRLPRYQPMIRQVAREYNIDWQLLAAVSYQESHWNPTATSPTGVRGMMMLTLPTAEELGIDNRLDALQSLRGGARYLNNMKLRLPEEVAEPDRTWMALAAYNIGLGHLRDARRLAQQQGGDPNLWSDVMEVLPLLQRSNYYRQTRHGYARGKEAVTYVQNIRHYRSILEWQDIPRHQPSPPIDIIELLPHPVRSVNMSAL